MGDLPRGKNDLILWVTYLGKKKMENGLILWVTYPDGKNVKCGLIVMGDLPRWKKCEKWSHCNG